MRKCLFMSITIFVLTFATSNSAGEDRSRTYPEPQRGKNLHDCVKMLDEQDGDWCEIRVNNDHPSISSVWPENLDRKTHMYSGPSSILIGWNSAAFDEKRGLMYFMDGGHGNYGGNEVYEFDLDKGAWTRLTESSPLNSLFRCARLE